MIPKESKFKIRSLHVSDAQEVTSIYNFSLDFLSRNEPISQDKVKELIRKNKDFFIGTFLGKQLVGHLLLTKKDGGNKILDIGIVIHSNYQRKGIGTLLIKKALDIANLSDYRKIEAEILEDNHTSIKFFKKNGFRTVGKSDRTIVKNDREINLIKCEHSLD